MNDGRDGDDTRRAIWEALDTMEDALSGGYRTGRAVPDFSAPGTPAEASTARPGPAEAEAPAPGIERGAAPGQGLPDVSGDSLAAAESQVARCSACRLVSGRARTVFGQGSPDPVVIVVGEGPGAEEDAQGLPFVGAAGRLLDKMLAAIDISRGKNAYIANIVKCRPPMNRDPAPDEQAACMPYLLRQIALLRPRAILTVGRIPTQALLGTKEGITRLRGRQYEFHGIPLVPTFHPSAILRDEALKRPAWEDLKLLKSITG